MYPYLNIGSIHLNLYFTLMALALLIPIYWGPKRAETMLPERVREVNTMVLVMFFSVLAGFRLFHVFFELPGYYLENPLEIFQVWKGGFVAYGGLFGAIFSGWLFIRIKKLPPLITADILAAPIAMTFVVARVACFLNGCCYGRPTDFALGVCFPPGSVAPPDIHIHPTQLYLSGAALITFCLIIFFEKRGRSYFTGLSTSIFLLLYPLARFIVEFYRADFRGGTFFDLSVSQWLSLGLMALGLVVLDRARKGAKSS